MNVEQLQTQRFLGIEEHNDHYCGPARDKPREAFNPLLHVQQGHFVMLHPDDTNIYLVWLAMAKSNINDEPT